MRGLHLFLILGLLLGLGGCGSRASAPAPRPTNPESLDETIRAAIDAAIITAEASPEDAAAWLELGMLYEAHGDDPPAIDCYERCLALDATEPKARYLLACRLHARGSIDEALVEMTRAGQDAPKFVPARWRLALWYLESGDANSAAAWAAQARALAPNDSVCALVAARVHISRGEHDKAIQVLEPLVAAAPQNGYGRFLLGTAYRGAGRMAEAQRELEVGTASAPQFVDAWLDEVHAHRVSLRSQITEAMALASSGRDVKEAVRRLEALHAAQLDDVDLAVNLAIAYRYAKRLGDAIDVLEEVTAERPGYDMGHFHLAAVLRDHARSGGTPDPALLTRALVHADALVGLSPTWGPGFGMRGELLGALDRPMEAIEAYSNAARLEPRNFLWPMRMGMLLCRVSQWETAIPYLEKSLDLARGEVEIYLYLGAAQANTGRIAEARVTIERGLKIDPNHAGLLNARRQIKDPDG